MRPELVQNIHIRIIVSDRNRISFLKSSFSKNIIRFVNKFQVNIVGMGFLHRTGR